MAKNDRRKCFVCRRDIALAEKTWFDEIVDAPICEHCTGVQIDYLPYFRAVVGERMRERRELIALRELAATAKTLWFGWDRVGESYRIDVADLKGLGAALDKLRDLDNPGPNQDQLHAMRIAGADDAEKGGPV